jgi:hypothetical protein
LFDLHPHWRGVKIFIRTLTRTEQGSYVTIKSSDSGASFHAKRPGCWTERHTSAFGDP